MSSLLNKTFHSREELKVEAQQISRRDGYAITTKSSGKRHLYLQCRCGGNFRNNHELTGETRKIHRDTFRVNCPFVIKAVPLLDGQWKVIHVNDEHNHDMSVDPIVFHQHRKLDEDHLDIVEKMIKAHAKPKLICDALRDDSKKRTMIPKDIDNLRSRLFPKADQANSKMAFIGEFFRERGYEIRYQYDGQKQLRSLFFAHPASIVKAKRFPESVIIDATYKTNQYKMPFVNVVGVDNIGRKSLATFAIAGAWISDETTESYLWVAKNLQSIVWGESLSPGVITTDNDTSVITGFQNVFPKTSYLLCTVHIRANFKKNCRKGFSREDQFEALMKTVDQMIYSANEDRFEAARYDFMEVAQFSRNGDAIASYLDRMLKKKEQWVGAYTRNLLHFGSTTSNRVEGAHAMIKDALKSSGSLLTAISKIDTCIRFQKEASTMNAEKERFGRDPFLVDGHKEKLSQILGKISQFAIDMIKNELGHLDMHGPSDPTRTCNCKVKLNFGLPCHHHIPAVGQLPLSIINPRWLLDAQPEEPTEPFPSTSLSKRVEVVEDRLVRALYALEEKVGSLQDDQQKEALLDQLDRIAGSTVIGLSDLKEPHLVTPKGRPQNTKRLRTALELQEEKIEQEQKHERKKYKAALKSSKKQKTAIKQEAVSRQEVPRFLDGVKIDPSIPFAMVKNVYNPEADGNCGFRALAMAVRGDESHWQLVKLAMMSHLRENEEHYRRHLCYDTVALEKILESRASPCSREFWFVSPDCAQLAADTLITPIAVYTGRGSNALMFFPTAKRLEGDVPPIVLQFVNDNHIILVEVANRGFPWPIVNPQHIYACKALDIDDEWSTTYK